MFKNKVELTQEQPSQVLGREVEKFLTQHEIKSLHVRSASHFGSTQFVQFKKAN